MRRLILAASLALLCPLALQVHAQAPDGGFDAAPAQSAAARAAHQTWMQRSAAGLAATGQPRELALAATLRQMALSPVDPAAADGFPPVAGPVDASVDAWQRRAADTAGIDPLANVLLLHGDEAQRLRAAQRWLGADPTNLAPLLLRDGSAEVLLADARGSSRFDLHMLAYVRWVQAALLRTPPTNEERAAFAESGEFVAAEYAAIQAMGLWAAVAIPGLQPLTAGCDASVLQGDPARARDCRHIAGVMANGSDTVLGQLVGLSLLDRLAATPRERSEVQARRRTLDWRNLEWGRASAALPRDGADQLVRLLADELVDSEPELVERALQDAGIALDPPAGWHAPAI